MSGNRPSHQTIAYLCDTTRLGDAERAVVDLVARIEGLTAGWYRPWVVVPQPDGPLVDQLVDLGVAHAVLPMPKGLASTGRPRPLRTLVSGALAWPAERAYLGRLRKLLDEQRPALIHTAGVQSHALAARLEAGVPVLWHLGEIMEQSPARMMLRRLRRSPGVHVLATSYAAAMAFEPDVARPMVVYNGIDLDRFVPARDPIFRERFRVPDEVPIIGAVGQIRRGKGLTEFVRMAVALHGSGFDARYVVVGDEIQGERRDEGLKAELESRVDEAGLAKVFQFVGFHQDSVRVMQGLDCLVSAANQPEAFDRDLVEAMACGVPVVAPALGGALEIIDDKSSGRLFRAGDLEGMASAVLDVLSDRQLRQQCIDGGRQRVLERFALADYVAGVVRAYDRLKLSGR